MLRSPVTSSHIFYIARHMREADRAEVAAASGLPPEKVLAEGVRRSADSMVYTGPTGAPVFIVGVVEPGIIWLLATDGILKHKRALHKLAPLVLKQWHLRWPRMGNIVDARNTIHIRWLKAMGFQFGEPIIAGVAQIPFLPFHRTVPHV